MSSRPATPQTASFIFTATLSLLNTLIVETPRLLPLSGRSRPGRPVSPGRTPPVAESPEPGTQALGLDVVGLLLGDLSRVPLPLLRLLLIGTGRRQTLDKRNKGVQRQAASTVLEAALSDKTTEINFVLKGLITTSHYINGVLRCGLSYIV